MKYLSLISLLFTFSSYAIGPSQFDINIFFDDAKFIGTGVVISGQVEPKLDPLNSCGATFDIQVETEILGAKTGEIIKVHHLMDYRFPSLEVGSKYFFYAEDRSTHKLINLGDEIDPSLSDPKPELCHSKTTNLYIYREFTQKINEEDGFRWLGDFSRDNWTGLQQIKQTKQFPRVYSGFKDSKFGMFTEAKGFGYGNELVFGGAIQLEPVIKLFQDQAKKSLNKPLKRN